MAKVEQRRILDVEAKDIYVDFDEFDGKTPAQIIEGMQYYIDKEHGRDLYFHIESYGYDGGKELKMRERRLENDREFNKRIAEEKKVKDKAKADKAAKEAKELAEYERLKKKYGA